MFGVKKAILLKMFSKGIVNIKLGLILCMVVINFVPLYRSIYEVNKEVEPEDIINEVKDLVDKVI